MSVPDYQSFMKPMLEFSLDQKEHSIKEAYDALAEVFGLNVEDKTEVLPSGRQETYKNRIGWARTYLGKAGLLENTRRGHFRITDRGIQELSAHGDDISTSYLRKYDEFVKFQSTSREIEKKPAGVEPDSSATHTPEEMIESALAELNEQLSVEIIEALQNVSPSYFERIVIDVLVSMGYGGSRKEAAKVVGKSGDGGIDGIIKEDKLGLDTIYVQAKRWENPVGRPEIQKFVGALQGHRSSKGIFITSSSFTREASEYAVQVQNRVILIDGKQLSDLMIEHGIGTTTIGSYSVKRLDGDYF